MRRATLPRDGLHVRGEKNNDKTAWKNFFCCCFDVFVFVVDVAVFVFVAVVVVVVVVVVVAAAAAATEATMGKTASMNNNDQKRYLKKSNCTVQYRNKKIQKNTFGEGTKNGLSSIVTRLLFFSST